MTRVTGPDDPTTQLLTDALDRARTDPRWAVDPRRLDVATVLRQGTARRRRSAVVTVAAAVVLVGAGSLGVARLSGHEGRDSLRPAAPSVSAVPGATAVPGISPAWVPTSGRDWLVSQEQYDAFEQTHRLPSPAPGQSTVQSPAPLTHASAALEARARRELPEGATVRREDAPGGQPGVFALHVRLADGTPLEVEQSTLQGPMSTGQQEQCACDVPPPGWVPPTVTDVPGTTSAAVVSPDAPYGFAGRDDRSESVTVVDRDGRFTAWTSPVSVPLSSLQAWAFAAAS